MNNTMKVIGLEFSKTFILKNGVQLCVQQHNSDEAGFCIQCHTIFIVEGDFHEDGTPKATSIRILLPTFSADPEDMDRRLQVFNQEYAEEFWTIVEELHHLHGRTEEFVRAPTTPTLDMFNDKLARDAEKRMASFVGRHNSTLN